MSRVAVVVAGLAAAVLSAAPAPAQAAAPAAPVGVWAFCGVHPDAPHAAQQARAMSWSGVDATFGPCMAPDRTTYTPSNTGPRYVTPDVYMRLVNLNAAAGMRTVVYDARVWSDDPAVRQTAISFWRPVIDHVAAFDMGDEFDPRTTEWPILLHRWQTVTAEVTPALGVAPYTNHLADPAILTQAAADLPGPILSFDSYTLDANGIAQDTLTLAREFDSATPDLMCAVNALPFNGLVPTWSGIAANMWQMRAAGCDSFLLFGGARPYGATPDTVDPFFGPSIAEAGWLPVLGIGVRAG